MATLCSVLAWRIPGTGGLVGCCLWGRTESDTTEVTWQQQQQYAGLPVESSLFFSVNYISDCRYMNICTYTLHFI